MPLFNPAHSFVWIPNGDQVVQTYTGYTDFDDLVVTQAQLVIPVHAKSVWINAIYTATITGAQTPGNVVCRLDAWDSDLNFFSTEENRNSYMAANATTLVFYFAFLCAVGTGGVNLEFGLQALGAVMPTNHTVTIDLYATAWSY